MMAIASPRGPAPPSRRPSLVRDEGGATAVEFALVALPFLMLCLAMLQFVLLHYTQQSLSDALLSSASAPEAELFAENKAGYIQKVCAKIYVGTDCASTLKVELMRLDDVSTTQTAITGATFDSGAAGDVLVLRAMLMTTQVVGFVPQLTAKDSVVFRRP